VHLVDMLALRPVPAAAVFLSLTRRCPLACAHCSTNSTLTSDEQPAEVFLRFVNSFTPADHPDILMLTGGEALLRPKLVQQLIEVAHAVGTKVCVISGMFFAREPAVPKLISDVIATVDHFTASLDVFHEQQVPRAAVFRVLRELVDRGQHVSLQVVGLDGNDPYLADVIDDIRRTFDDRVPILVAQVRAVGRAKAWMGQHAPELPLTIDPAPCVLAAWPTVAFDGAVVACCNQAVVDGPHPAHLLLGHAAVDDWTTIRQRCLSSPFVRAIRVFGPHYVADRFGSGNQQCDGYCPTCHKVANDPAVIEPLEPVIGRATMPIVEKQVMLMQQERFSQGILAYEHLRWLGYAPEKRSLCVG
jgi:pyruvate-formate lyase-activating enzyme